MEGSSFDACFNGRGIHALLYLPIFFSPSFVLSELINMNQHGQTNVFVSCNRSLARYSSAPERPHFPFPKKENVIMLL